MLRGRSTLSFILEDIQHLASSMASIEELDLKISEASSLYTRLKSSLAENEVAEMDVVIF